MPNVADGLLNKYWHIAALARGQASAGASQAASVLTGLLTLEGLDETPAETLSAGALSAAYGGVGAGAGGLSVTA